MDTPSVHQGQSFFYGIRRGLVPGVYATWRDAQRQIATYPHPMYKKFSTAAEAHKYAFPWKDAAADPSVQWAQENVSRPSTGLQKAEQLILWVDQMKKDSAKLRSSLVPEEHLKEIENSIIYPTFSGSAGSEADTRKVSTVPIQHRVHVWMAVEFSRLGSWFCYFGPDDPRNCFSFFPHKIMMPHRVRLSACIHAVNAVLEWCEQQRIESNTVCAYLHTESVHTLKLINGWLKRTLRAPWYADVRVDDKELFYSLYRQLTSTGIRFECCQEKSATPGMRSAYKMLLARVPKNRSGGGESLSIIGWNATKRELISGSEEVSHTKGPGTVEDALEDFVDLSEDTSTPDPTSNGPRSTLFIREEEPPQTVDEIEFVERLRKTVDTTRLTRVLDSLLTEDAADPLDIQPAYVPRKQVLDLMDDIYE